MKTSRFRINRKTIALQYEIKEDLNKDVLANAIHDSIRSKIDVMIIAKTKSQDMTNCYHVYIEFERKIDTRDKCYFNTLVDDECYEPTVLTQFRKTEYIKQLVNYDKEWYEEGKDVSKYIQSDHLHIRQERLEVIAKIQEGAEPEQIEQEYPEIYYNEPDKVNKYSAFHKYKKRRLEPTIGFKKLDVQLLEDDKQQAIAEWYNIRLVDLFYEKPIAGLYIWSKEINMGKTELIKVLKMIDKCYEWTYNDGKWQQNWNKGMDYKLIVFNAMNGPYVEFELIEQLGDEVNYSIPQRYETNQGFINAGLPFIITSNKPPDELGYSDHKKIDPIWLGRMIVIELDEPIFPLLELLRKLHGLESFEQSRQFNIFDNPILSKYITQ